MHLIDALALPTQPWRNGGGLTRELLRQPSGDAWRVRLSMADITRDGPFSSFPDVTRWFVVLAGKGVRLDLPEGAVRLEADSAPLRFAGAAAPDCTLLDGPVRDLNLMLRSGHGGLAPVGPDPWQPPPGASAGLLSRVAGHWRCGAQSLHLPAWHLLLDAPRQEEPWRFDPDASCGDSPAGWWFFHDNEGFP